MKKLNILLILPRLVKTIGEGYQFPLGIAYISASLKSNGFRVFTLNLNHDNRSVVEIIHENISKFEIDVVASGGISIQYSSLYEIFNCTKKINQSIITIAGGGIISADPEVAMQALEMVDIGVIGEGEITICNLISALENQTDLANIKGIIFKRNNYFIKNKPQPEIKDIDLIPYPDYDGFQLEKYLELPPPDVNNLMENRLAFFLGSRSCPYNCTFCFHSVGKKYRQRSMQSIKQEIDFLVEKYKIGFLFMADELFGKPKERLREFCNYMNKKKLMWRGSFRVDDIDEETIEMLKHGNCSIIGLGLESMDNTILKSMRKNITKEQIEKALLLIFNAKVPFSGNFIFGDKNETYQTAKNTIDWWEQHPEYNINLWPIVAYPGSYLYNYACENGIIKDKIQFLKDGCPAVNVTKMNNTELSWLAKTILESPMKSAKNLKNVTVVNVNPDNKRVTLSANCAQCSNINYWENIRLLISVNLACTTCAQKHNTPFPIDLQSNIASEIENLIKKKSNIAIWGVTMHSIGLFESFDIFKSPNIYFIDNVAMKQMIEIQGKKVYSPDILNEIDISLVISFYPNSTQQIEEQIKAKYQQVNCIINAHDLFV